MFEIRRAPVDTYSCFMPFSPPSYSKGRGEPPTSLKSPIHSLPKDTMSTFLNVNSVVEFRRLVTLPVRKHTLIELDLLFFLQKYTHRIEIESSDWRNN